MKLFDITRPIRTGMPVWPGDTPAEFSFANTKAAGYAANVLTGGAADNVVRILPPLTITDEEIAEGTARLDRAAATLARDAA